MKTYSPKKSDIRPVWHVIDAQGQVLGRLAARIAHVLQGKGRPTYSPHMDMKDYVIVVNAERVRVTGKKLRDKVYYHHSGYPGGLKETTLGDMLKRHPTRVIEKAVRGMLSHSPRGRQLYRHLKVYAGPEHPHQAQVIGGERASQERAGAAPPRSSPAAPSSGA